MTSNPSSNSAASLPPHVSASLSSGSQSTFAEMTKAFNYIPIRLDPNNFLFWKAHISATIRAFDLQSFIKKTPHPPKFITTSDVDAADSTTVNPEFLTWMRSDQLLLGWLFSTIDKEVLAQVIHCESSSEVWSCLESLYSRQTTAKSFQLKQQLRSVKKESMSINDYILKIKTIGHSLAAIGEPLSDKDVFLAILNGLDQEFETVVSLITYQMDDIDLDKV